MNFIKKPFRIPGVLNDKMRQIYAKSGRFPNLNDFAHHAIEVAAANFDVLKSDYYKPLLPSTGRKPMVVFATSLSREHFRTLSDLVARLSEIRDASGKTLRPTPSVARVFRAALQILVNRWDADPEFKNGKLRHFLSTPRLVSKIATNRIEKCPTGTNVNFSMRDEFSRGQCFLVDSTILLVATLRTKKGNLDPVSRKSAQLLRGAEFGKPRVLLYRAEAEEYLRVLWKSLRSDENLSLFDGDEGDRKDKAEDEAKRFIIDVVAAFKASSIEIFDIDPDAVFMGEKFREKFPSLENCDQVAQALLLSAGNRFAIASATTIYCGFSGFRHGKNRIDVFHPNDIDLSAKEESEEEIARIKKDNYMKTSQVHRQVAPHRTPQAPVLEIINPETKSEAESTDGTIDIPF